MGAPLFLVENHFSIRQFPDHVITATEEDTGYEVDKVANGRRDVLDFWAPVSTNSTESFTTDTEVTGTLPTVLALDRGHNLAGETVQLRRSSDNFAASDVLVFSAVIPSTAASGGDIDTANGITTDEGAWLKRFSTSAMRYWRVQISPMGAGLKPKVIGCWLGESYEPGFFERGTRDEDSLLMQERIEHWTGWTGMGPPVKRRVGEVSLRLTSYTTTEYDQHIRDNYALGRPMWIVGDDEATERAVLGIRPASRMGIGFGADYAFKQGSIPWEEHEPYVNW